MSDSARSAIWAGQKRDLLRVVQRYRSLQQVGHVGQRAESTDHLLFRGTLALFHFGMRRKKRSTAIVVLIPNLYFVRTRNPTEPREPRQPLGHTLGILTSPLQAPSLRCLPVLGWVAERLSPHRCVNNTSVRYRPKKHSARKPELIHAHWLRRPGTVLSLPSQIPPNPPNGA